MKSGFVLGKFMPLHNGHINMIKFASALVDRLYVLVDNVPDEAIPLEKRVNIIQKTFIGYNIEVIPMPHVMPQSPSDRQDFWEIWISALTNILPNDVEYIIGSMEYIKEIANRLDIKFIMHDKNREEVAISATMIRNAPRKYFNYLPFESKKLYVKKICILGPECTGKSTLVKMLANQFGSQYVIEYAKRLIQENDSVLEYKDIPVILRAQKALVEISVESSINGVVFCDSDAITTKIWSEKMFGEYPSDINNFINNQDYDLYILLGYKGVDWQDDGARYYKNENEREQFMSAFLQAMSLYNLNHEIVEFTSFEDRFARVVNIINKFLNG